MSGKAAMGGERGAPGRKRLPRRLREREMVEAAARIFSERGYRATSMEEIATACGVSKPMLYAYFGSKEGLFAACGIPAGEELRGQLAELAAEDEGSPADQLWSGLLAIFRRIEDNRETWRLLYPAKGPAPSGALGARAAINRAAMAKLVEELMRRAALRSGIGEEVAATQITPIAHAVVGAVIAVATWSQAQEGESAEVQALRMMNLFWKGLESLNAGEAWVPG